MVMPTAIRDDALLRQPETDVLMKRIAQLIHFGRQYWRPLHVRMDYWASMYFLLDQVQQMKPLGYRRFISNEPQTAVDAAIAILTRNESFWRIDLNRMEAENNDERDKIGKIERTLHGIVNDIDELFSMRFEMPLWKQVSWQALMRGWIWGKFHVTTSALEYRDSPLVAEIYDSRLVYPHFDQYGMESVIIEKVTTLGDLASVHPATFDEFVRDRNFDPNRPVMKVEFWSNNRPGKPGVTGTLAVLAPLGQGGTSPYLPPDIVGGFFTARGDAGLSGARWVIPPHAHGYDPQSLPVVGVPVNGVPVKIKPSMPEAVSQHFAQRSDILGIQAREWHGPNTWVAESGRSLLASVEESLPQLNELVATILQHFALNTFGTWIFKTPTGELPRFEPNIEARIPLRPEESVERVEPAPLTADAYRLLEVLRQEQQQGTLSAILRATLPGGGGDLSSGILFQQMTNAALNALEPFHDGLEQFGMRMGTSLLAQFQLSARELRPFSVSVPFKQNTFVDIEFDPQVDLETGRKYKTRPIFKPALPDDMTIRIQMARLALDPRRPILSLVSVLETILQWEDPSGEVDRIWEDLANQDPLIVLEQIATALEKMDEPEMAARIREQQFRAKFVEDAQFRQLSGAVPGLGQGGAETGRLNMGPEGGTPNSTTRNNGGPEGGAAQAAQAQQGMELVGSVGTRSGI